MTRSCVSATCPVHPQTLVPVNIYVRMYKYVEDIYIYTFVCMHMHVCICMYAYAYAILNEDIYMHMCIYIFRHTCVQQLAQLNFYL